jgi:tetratricopeptide (TPR) repeat protein
MERRADEVERLLETLVDTHLVETASTAGRYRFHDLVRLYAREQAQAEETESDREAALLRMLEWYLDTADAAERLLIPGRVRLPYEPTGLWDEPTLATSGEALTWFDAEKANLVAATHQAASLGLHSLAWQIPDALWSFLFLSWDQPDLRDMHRTGLAAAREAGNRQAEAWMLSSLGDFELELQQVDEEVVHMFVQSVAICREIGDREGEARALCGLGHSEIHMRRFDEAINCEQEALTISREIGYVYRQGVALYHLGQAYCDLGRLEEALDCHRQALTIRRELSDRWNVRRSLNYLSKVFCDLQRFEEAIESAERSLTIARELGHRWGEARALESLGVALHHTQGVEAARLCWEQALVIFTELGAPQADEVRARLEENHEALQSNT